MDLTSGKGEIDPDERLATSLFLAGSGKDFLLDADTKDRFIAGLEVINPGLAEQVQSLVTKVEDSEGDRSGVPNWRQIEIVFINDEPEWHVVHRDPMDLDDLPNTV